MGPESLPIPAAKIAGAGMMGRISALLFQGERGIGLAPLQPLFALQAPEDAMVFPGLLVGRPDEVMKTLAHAVPALARHRQGRFGHVSHLSTHEVNAHRRTRCIWVFPNTADC